MIKMTHCARLPLWLIALWLASVSAQTSPLIETHELNAWIYRDNRPIYLLEIVGLGETADMTLDKQIPGAKYLPMKSLIDPSAAPLVKAPKLEGFKEVMKTYGVQKNNVMVVLYDSKGMKSASMVWWIMNLFGRDNSKVLNGGLPKWLREGYRNQTGGSPGLLNPILEDDTLYQYIYNPKKIWSSYDVDLLKEQLLNTPNQMLAQLVDVRARSEFDLLYVKGSINMPVEIVSRADGTLRSAIELKAIFEGYQVNITNETLTVVISQNGVDSSAALLALAAVGKDSYANVDGGWQEFTQYTRIKETQPAPPQPGPQPGSSTPQPAPASTPVPSTTPPTPSTPSPTTPGTPVTNTTSPTPSTQPSPNASPQPVRLAQHSCDLSCSMSCIQDLTANKAECWDACACPASFIQSTEVQESFKLRSDSVATSSLPQTLEETDQLLSFISCSRTCNSICNLGESRNHQCRDRCAFSFCFKDIESEPTSLTPEGKKFDLTYAAVMGLSVFGLFGFYCGFGAVRRVTKESLLDQ